VDLNDVFVFYLKKGDENIFLHIENRKTLFSTITIQLTRYKTLLFKEINI